MTDQNEQLYQDEQLPELTDEQEADRDLWVTNENRQRDLDLGALLEVVFGPDDENETSDIQLTLITSGTVISGRAVARSAWLKQLNADLDHEYLNNVLGIIEDQTSKVKKVQREQVKAEGRPLLMRKHVYLLDAQVFGNGRVHKLAATKIDLSHVGAWSCGNPG